MRAAARVGEHRTIRVAELFDAPREQLDRAIGSTIPPDVHSRATETTAGIYVTLERRLADPPRLRRLGAIRYLQGLVDDIRRELMSHQE